MYVDLFIPAELPNSDKNFKSRLKYQKQTHRQQNKDVNDC